MSVQHHVLIVTTKKINMKKSTFISIIAVSLTVSALVLLLIASEKRASNVMKQDYCFFEQEDGSLGHYACEGGTGGSIPNGVAGGSNKGGI